MCRDIGCELYVDHYCRDLPELHCIRSTALPAIAKGYIFEQIQHCFREVNGIVWCSFKKSEPAFIIS